MTESITAGRLGRPREYYGWMWPGATMQIAESIAARERPRGCYELALVQPGRDYGIYRRSGTPEGML